MNSFDASNPIARVCVKTALDGAIDLLEAAIQDPDRYESELFSIDWTCERPEGFVVA